MTRQLEVVREERETKRRDALVRSLEFGLAGALESQGIVMCGFAVKYDAFECLMTLKAEIGGKRQVCHIGAASPIDCILRAVQMAQNDRLRWKADLWPPKTP